MGSVTSALTFDDYTDLSHANTAAVAAAEAESSTVTGAGAVGAAAEEAAGAAAEQADVAQGHDEGEEAPGNNSLACGAGAERSSGLTTTPGGGRHDAVAVVCATASGVAPHPSADGGDTREFGPALASMSPRRSSEDQETTANGPTPATAAAAASTATSGAALSEAAGTGKDGSSGVDGAAAGDCDSDERRNRPGNIAQNNTKCSGEGEGEGEGAAEWWREALGPTSRRPVTRRSLISGGVIGSGASSAGCIWEQQGGGARREGGVNGMVDSGDGGGSSGCRGDRRRSRAAAPICGFSTESKHRNLEDFLKRRCDEGGRVGQRGKITITIQLTKRSDGLNFLPSPLVA